MARKIANGSVARQNLLRGMKHVEQSVSCTLGPKGRNVVLDKSHLNGTCFITNDGVSIARDMEFQDEFENQGAQLLIQIANKTNDQVGDGTTTSIVLAVAMLEEAVKYIEAGYNPVLLRKAMRQAVHLACQWMEKQAVIVDKDKLFSIAFSSIKDEELSQMVIEAIQLTEGGNFVTIENSKARTSQIRFLEGMRLKSGYLSKYLCTEKKEQKIKYENAYVFVSNWNISNVQTILPLLEKIMREDRPLLMIVDDLTGDALTTVIMNHVQGNIKIAVIKAPGFGDMRQDMLEDIAIYTNAEFLGAEKGMNLETIQEGYLGTATEISIDATDTLIMNRNVSKERLHDRINKIQKVMMDSTSEYNKERYRERISKLSGGISVIEVGGDTELEVIEKKLRVEDGIAAVKAAMEGGIVSGGGSLYIHAARELEKQSQFMENEELLGSKIIQRAMRKPLWQIAENAGVAGTIVVDRVNGMQIAFGFDAMEESYCNMVEKGIVDPWKVVKNALLNAESVVSTVITTEVMNVIVKNTEESLESIGNK